MVMWIFVELGKSERSKNDFRAFSRFRKWISVHQKGLENTIDPSESIRNGSELMCNASTEIISIDMD